MQKNAGNPVRSRVKTGDRAENSGEKSPDEAHSEIFIKYHSISCVFHRTPYLRFQTFDKSVTILEYMIIERPIYLKELLLSRGNGSTKILHESAAVESPIC